MKNTNNWYMEGIKDIMSKQQFEIDELEAAINYMESKESKTEANLKMIAEYKQELAEAIEDLKSTKQYMKSVEKYIA